MNVPRVQYSFHGGNVQIGARAALLPEHGGDGVVADVVADPDAAAEDLGRRVLVVALVHQDACKGVASLCDVVLVAVKQDVSSSRD